jgi:uncharacterized protein (TIGR04255 family)
MVAIRHLQNAPIREAIIDLRVKLPSGITHEKLATLQESIKDQYPGKKYRRESQFAIKIKEGEPVKGVLKNEGVLGYLFLSADNTQIVQFRLDGFTYSKLKPYDSWENLRDEANRLWNLYSGSLNPEIINRVAVRYINNMEIPLPIKDFDEYLTSPPIVPKALPQSLSSFLTRMVIPDPSLPATAIITQSLEPTLKPNLISILLDIDVFREDNFDPNNLSSWDFIEKLRTYKNKIFFESITEKTVELFK